MGNPLMAATSPMISPKRSVIRRGPSCCTTVAVVTREREKPDAESPSMEASSSASMMPSSSGPPQGKRRDAWRGSPLQAIRVLVRARTSERIEKRPMSNMRRMGTRWLVPVFWTGCSNNLCPRGALAGESRMNGSLWGFILRIHFSHDVIFCQVI